MSNLLAVVAASRRFAVAGQAAPVATTVTISGNSSVAVGATAQLTAVVRDQYGAVMAGESVTWSSTGAATVSSAGLVTGQSAGSATITATSGSASGTYAVTVTAAVLTAGTATATPGDGQISLSATAPTGGTAPYTYQWYRSASAGTKGSPIAGATALTYTDAGRTNGTPYYYTLTATDAVSASVDYTQKSATPAAAGSYVIAQKQLPSTSPYAGSTMQVGVTVQNGSGVGQVGVMVDWSVDDPTVAVLSGTSSQSVFAGTDYMRVHFLKVGTAQVTASYGGASYTFTLTSVPNVLVWPPTAVTVPGNPVQLVAKDVVGNPIDASGVTWQSLNTSVATVNSAGLVTPGASPGTATIRGTEAGTGRTSDCTFVVTAKTAFAGPYNEPAGMTPSFWSKGTANTTGEDGSAGESLLHMGDANYCPVVTDADAPYGTAVEFRWPNAEYGTGVYKDGEDATAFCTFRHNPVINAVASEVYYRLVIQHAPFWVHQVGGDKLMYFGSRQTTNGYFLALRNRPDAGPVIATNYWLGYQDQAGGGNAKFWSCAVDPVTHQAGLIAPPGQYHVYEVYMKSESVAGAADGVLRIWVDGVLAVDADPTSFYPQSPLDGGFKGFEWRPYWGGAGGYHKSLAGLPVGMSDWLRYGEMYMSVKI